VKPEGESGFTAVCSDWKERVHRSWTARHVRVKEKTMDIELQVGLTLAQVDAVEQLARASRSALAVGVRSRRPITFEGEEFEALELQHVADEYDPEEAPVIAAVIGEGEAARRDSMFFAQAKASVLALVSDWRRLTGYVSRLEAEVEDKRAIRDAANALAATILRCAPQLVEGKGLVPVDACRVAAQYVQATRGRSLEANMDDRSSMLGRDER
jgi:hypothetical protein